MRSVELAVLFVGVAIALSGCAPRESAPEPAPDPVGTAYLERYFATFPSRATAAGRRERDAELEDLGVETRADWIAFNRETAAEMDALLADPELDRDRRFDAELLSRRARRVVFDWETLRRPERDPLFWSGLAANATVFLLVRDDLPEAERLASAAERARQLPRLAEQAKAALGATDPAEIAPEFARVAARQLAGSARFYRAGFAEAAGDEPLRARLAAAGGSAAPALADLASFFEELAERASGSPRLGEHYGARFALVTGVETPPAEVLAEAELALAAKRTEAAGYGRSIWGEVFPGEAAPADDTAVVARLFERIGENRAASTEEFIADYRDLIERSVAFVRERGIVTLPEPLTLHTDRSPSFFVGQSVGGVYAAGPYAPESDTLLFLPTPPDDAPPEAREAFFRDFNHHFNVMITPHEVIPGHYLQLKYAARQPSRIRALFGDGVYIEGWGTFCERLMLDEGWGGPLDRVAHLKKQLENIARTIVDIRVHTTDVGREEVLAFVRDEALQDEQFAGNMWMRSITSAPQLTFYYLGYRQVHGLYEEVRAARGEGFELREFMDGMMEHGPVAVAHYRELMLGE